MENTSGSSSDTSGGEGGGAGGAGGQALHPAHPQNTDPDEYDSSEGSDYIPTDDEEDDSEIDDIFESESDDSDTQIESRPLPPKRQRTPASGSASEGEFQWRLVDNFVPDQLDFHGTGGEGITENYRLRDNPEECDFFLPYFDDDLLDMIVTESNRYYQQKQTATRPSSHKKQWRDITHNELLAFLAITMLMPHCQKHVLVEYWARDDPLFIPIFAEYFTRDRYRNILRYLHFANDAEDENDNDPLWKIRRLMTNITEKCNIFFKPYKKVVIDESLMLFKGRVKFKQYIPSKRSRFGIKIFHICDCDSGIVLDMCIYSASDADINKNNPLGFSGAVVQHLMRGYLGKGHVLYTDNYYTSPQLAKYLIDNGTGLVGTLRKNRKHLPKFQATNTRGAVQKHESNGILVLQWTDKRQVLLLSTIHRGEMKATTKKDRTGENILKPDVVSDYNINMRMIDKNDMMITSVNCLRKSRKWSRKVFFHLLDICLLNAYNMYVEGTGNQSSLRTFNKKVALQLLQRFGTRSNIHLHPGRRSQEARENPLPRLQFTDAMELHSPVNVPPTPGRPGKGQRECVVCKNTSLRPKKRRKVTTMCETCDVGLCIGPCFKAYHTLASF